MPYSGLDIAYPNQFDQLSKGLRYFCLNRGITINEDPCKLQWSFLFSTLTSVKFIEAQKTNR